MSDQRFKDFETKNIFEALEKSDLIWSVSPQPIITQGGVDCPKHKAIIREDNKVVLDVSKVSYNPISNAEAFGILEGLNLTYVKGGAIDGGKKVFLQADLGNSDIGGGDEVKKYLTIINSFDGTLPFRFYMTPIRLFCSNALNRSWRYKSESMSIRHTKTAQVRLESLKLQLEGIKYSYMEVIAEYKKFKQAFLQKEQIEHFIKETINWDYKKEEESTRKMNIYNQIEDRVYNGYGNTGSTVWDAYNGVIEWHDHKNLDDAKHTIFKPQIKERAYKMAESFIK